MLNTIFTLDYEIHGNGEGDPHELMVEPTRRMLAFFERYGAKLTIMADVAEILKFKEYKEQVGRDDYHYDAIAAQLCDAIQRGHDVQLHLHCSYFNARHTHGRWLQDWSEYNFAGLSPERLNEVLRIGKSFLEDLLKPVNQNYRCTIFRAANWAVSPSRNLVRALLHNGFSIDTSVFKYGSRSGVVSFDYSHAASSLAPWLADESEICRHDSNGLLIEAPIYSERRWIGCFLTLQRVRRAWYTRQHRIVCSARGDNPPFQAGSKKHRLAGLTRLALGLHAWKADFNQCTGNQLIKALQRAHKLSAAAARTPFVLIGHSKLWTDYNEKSLSPFLEHIRSQPHRLRFTTFGTAEITRSYTQTYWNGLGGTARHQAACGVTHL